MDFFNKGIPDLKIFKKEIQNEILRLAKGNDDDPLLLILQWEDNTTRQQKDRIIQLNDSVVRYQGDNNTASDAVFLITDPDNSKNFQTVMNAVTALQVEYLPLNGNMLARMFVVQAERKDKFVVFEPGHLFT